MQLLTPILQGAVLAGCDENKPILTASEDVADQDLSVALVCRSRPETRLLAQDQ
jgi:hypothetical protein